MKKIWAVINLGADETAQNLLSAFFSKEEFNLQNTILIEERTAVVEVFFEEKPPQKIAEAIGGYNEVRCGFGEVSAEVLKKGGKSLDQVYPANTDERDLLTVPDGDEAGEELPAAEPTNEVVPAEVDNASSSEDVSVGDEVGEELPAIAPTSEGVPDEVGESKDENNEQAVVSGRKKSRKAPECIPQIDDIARRCASYKQFAGAVAKWLELGKRESYFVDLAETAADVEKIAWTPIEKELGKKGYNNPLAIRQRTSANVTKKLTQMGIDFSFIALVEYVAKYKSFDFRSGIKPRVSEILSAMGIEKEVPEIQKWLTSVAIAAVMAEHDKVKLRAAVYSGESVDSIV